MKYLIGYTADQGGREALALGTLLARSSGGSIVVATMLPETWGHPSMARVDVEYANFLNEHARKSLDKARAIVGEQVPAEFISRSASSVREGLFAAASDLSADMLVLGSTRGAPAGRVAGSVTSSVLHSAPLPVALAPRGYAPDPKDVLGRITCAFAAAPDSASTVRNAAALCEKYKVPLRLVTFVVRDQQMYPTGVGYKAENMVSNQWRTQAVVAQKKVIAELALKPSATGSIADGKTWKAALASLPWKAAEVIALGSGSLGPLLRVFLGSTAVKIISNATVPCIILPRQASADVN